VLFENSDAVKPHIPIVIFSQVTILSLPVPQIGLFDMKITLFFHLEDFLPLYQSGPTLPVTPGAQETGR
jgi:hypothetical protein